jgi:hypothetical protein
MVGLKPATLFTHLGLHQGVLITRLCLSPLHPPAR